ncbi:MAG: hypothetical protein DU489_08080 [Nitrosomonas sp.]|uniref:hypothetical protein n=1 Tax=Nitrosomonas sp. TaxID=42353 RepID=UPI0032EAE7F1
MNCISQCEKSGAKECQDLSGWEGITYEELLVRLKKYINEEVRIYTVATTSLNKKTNRICHSGSGPNLEGKFATLCTCKHSMRQYHTLDEWKSVWILGLTSRAINKGFSGIHYLFYMMKIEQAFESHKDLCQYLNKQNYLALQHKSAVRNRLGDIFEPKLSCTEPLNPKMYKTPHKNHSHGLDNNWNDDIVYKGKSAPLLLGDVNNTFVWPQPKIIFDAERGVGNLKLPLGEDLFRYLKTCE